MERRRQNWIGHVLRGDSLLREVLEMEENMPKVRPRIGMLDGLMEGEKGNG